MTQPESAAGLTGVPQTLLWNLHQRAFAARQPSPVLSDPKAVELVDTAGYPFDETFGPPSPFLAQGQALRVRSFDTVVRNFLAGHPEGTVVALGEGLETQFWRVDNGRMNWLTVELPETAAVRRRLLPDGPRRRTVARSVLDPAWTEEVDTSRGVLVTAQGLLMYLRPSEVRRVISTCAEHFPGGSLVFDAVPRWFSARTVSGRMTTPSGYTPPPMPWGMNASEVAKVREAHPDITDVREVPLPRGRGVYYGVLHPLARHVPGVRDLRPTMTVLARFA
ncbi:methyltransferase [Streptomyces sp. 150FB]|uniref:class I SAM-dependent methyltransferase n=1 Tax=Streptomyces sp. 150FB TaxID=1576605 RepID=UPI000588E983|nr:class I SAM-dependent methyltransferase [Streptomyces sp. 150FB]KIF78326.1 methyltransferase [Streptomyces sp. 150FB]